jgi:hypothetical protein
MPDMLSWVEPAGAKLRISKAFNISEGRWGGGFIEVWCFR